MSFLASTPKGFVGRDSIDEPAQAVDLTGDLVARHDVGHAFRRAGEDRIARGQRHERTQVLDQAGNIEYQVAGVALLLELAVEMGPQRQIRGIRHIRCVDEPGPEHRPAVAILDAQVGPIPVLEVIANGVVIRNAVPGNMPHGRRAGDVLRRAADDHRQLAFIVHELHAGRTPRRTAMTQQRARALEEDQRFLLGIELELLRMIGIIETEGDDGPHLERRQPDDFRTADETAVVEQQFLRLVPRRYRLAPQFLRFAARSRAMNRARKSNPGAHHRAATNSFDKVPSSSAAISTRWPARTRGAGHATPRASTSPGMRVMNSVTSANSVAAERTKSAVLDV